jgi:hypothetical protein
MAGPVAGLGAAGAGLDVDEAVQRVGRVGEHAAELELLDRLAQLVRLGLDRAHAVEVASAFDMSYSSVLSDRLLLRWSMVSTTVSRVFFSRPSSCARLGSFQTPGFSSAALTSFSRSDLRS